MLAPRDLRQRRGLGRLRERARRGAGRFARARARRPPGRGAAPDPAARARSGDAYYRYEDDWGHSFPGRLARCAVPIFEASCLDMRSKLMSHECNFLLARTFRVLTTLPRSWSVYREDYKPYPGGGPVCAVLRDDFDGPPCPASEAEGRRVACRRYAHAAGLASPEAAAVDFHWSKNLKCGDLLGPADFAELEGWWRRHHDAATAGYDHGGFLGGEDDVEDGARARGLAYAAHHVRDAAFRDE